MDHKFKCCLSSIKTDNKGNAKVTLFVPMTEVVLIKDLSSEVNKVLEVTAKAI